jgi:hypothetical protein
VLVGGKATFLYEVTPMRAGTHSIRVVVGSRIRLPFGDERHDTVIEAGIINVPPAYGVRLSRFLVDNWQVIVLLPFLQPLIRAIGQKRRKRPIGF